MPVKSDCAVAPMTASNAERVLRSKIAAHTLWARTIDRTQATAKMRAGFDARFEREVDAIDPEHRLSDSMRRKLLENARTAYFSRLALLSLQVRRKKKEGKS